MKVTVIAEDSFIHGSHNLNRGDEASMDKSAADDLAAAGLVRIKKTDGDEKAADPPSNKQAADHDNKMAGPAENKAAADDEPKARRKTQKAD